MLVVLIDKHVAGWSSIVEADFSKETGWGKDGPQCYCHGGRSEEEYKVNEANAAEYGMEYVYVFSADGKRMQVLASYIGDGKKMIGMFGSGDASATWKVIGDVELDGEEPDWQNME